MKNTATDFEWWIFFLLSSSTLVLFIQAWVNLVRKEITSFSLDALIYFLIRTIGGKKNAKQAEKIIRETERIKRIGTIALIMAFSGVYNSIKWLTGHLLP